MDKSTVQLEPSFSRTYPDSDNMLCFQLFMEAQGNVITCHSPDLNFAAAAPAVTAAVATVLAAAAHLPFRY
jgi:hypothetical protein